ncbi:MAG: hypothetical protein JWN37_880 [Candidatus Nomurabacteria bacterium]|nr:hypothetical protein [Candidatus Nomurabacteria bacterium]
MMRHIKVTFDPDHFGKELGSVTPEDYIHQLRREVFPFISEEEDLKCILVEIVTNFCRHSTYGRGVLGIYRQGPYIWVYAEDFGPGYVGNSPKKDFISIARFHKEKFREGKREGGRGLYHILKSFNKIKREDVYRRVRYKVETKGRFFFAGLYASAIYDRLRP